VAVRPASLRRQDLTSGLLVPGCRVVACTVNVTTEASVEGHFKELPSGPHALVNNVGAGLSQQSIMESDNGDWWSDYVSLFQHHFNVSLWPLHDDDNCGQRAGCKRYGSALLCFAKNTDISSGTECKKRLPLQRSISVCAMGDDPP